MFSNFYHLSNYQQEVWSLINKFDSFNIKFIPHTKNSNISMLINEVSNLNLDDVETCRPLIPSTNWRNSNDDQHIYKGSIINEEQHEVFATQSEIKNLLKVTNISIGHKEEINVHALDNLCSQIGNVVSNQDNVRKAKMRNAQKIYLNPYRETGKTLLVEALFLK